MKTHRFGRRGSFRHHGAPLAHKQRIWIQTATTLTETNLTVSSAYIFNPTTDSVLAAPGTPGLQSCRVLRVLMTLRSTTPDDTGQSRFWGVYLDDSTDIAAGSWDPSVTAAGQNQPQRIFRWGLLDSPPAVASGATGSGVVGSGAYSNRDAVRDIKIGCKVRRDEAIGLAISPGTTGNLVTWSVVSRVLYELG